MTVDPQGKATVKITYILPLGLKADGYKLLVQKQPGTDADKLEVKIDGRKEFDGTLLKDVEVK
jgi:hypothetical protein